MHAPVLKRTPMHQFVGLALVLALVASIAVAAVAINRSGDDATTITDTPSESPRLALQQRYYDAKMARQEAMEAAAGAQYVAPAQASVADQLWQQEVDHLNQLAVVAAQKEVELRQLAMDRADWLYYELNQNLPVTSDKVAEPVIGVDSFQTDTRFAPTALDLFVTGAAQ